MTFVLMAGLPGTGKSTLAAALAMATRGVVLSKDTIRAALFPGNLTDYTEEQDNHCFRALLDAATYIAQHPPHPTHIFLDGRTFRKRSQIECAVHAAEDAHCRWRILLLTCPDDVAIRRITMDRQTGEHPARNRDKQLYLESRAHFANIDFPVLRVDTSATLEECVQHCLPYLATAGHEGSRRSG